MLVIRAAREVGIRFPRSARRDVARSRMAMAAHKVVHPVLTEEAGVAEASDTARSLLRVKQQAKSWELRAAMSMARLWRDQGQAAASSRTACSGLRLVH